MNANPQKRALIFGAMCGLLLVAVAVYLLYHRNDTPIEDAQIGGKISRTEAGSNGIKENAGARAGEIPVRAQSYGDLDGKPQSIAYTGVFSGTEPDAEFDLSFQVVEILGLSPSERKSVQQQFQALALKIARASLVTGEFATHVIHGQPANAARFREELYKGLKEAIGAERAGCLLQGFDVSGKHSATFRNYGADSVRLILHQVSEGPGGTPGNVGMDIEFRSGDIMESEEGGWGSNMGVFYPVDVPLLKYLNARVEEEGK
jgi:hypothetical protein